MRRSFLLIGAMLASSYCFANASSSTQLQALGSAWKTEQSLHAKQDKNDIAIVYGGADIFRRPTLVSHTTTV